MSRISPTRVAPAVPPWRNPRVQAIVWQALLVLALLALAVWLVTNARQALDERGMTSGLGFLFDPAQFAVGEAFFVFKPGSTYLAALAVGLGNTVMLSLVSILTATVLGAALGFARLSRNALIAGLAKAYVEAFRNTPQLVQIVFWYSFFTLLPGPRQSWSILDLAFASNRGLTVPAPENGDVFLLMLGMLALGALLALVFAHLADRHRRRTGRPWRLVRLTELAVLLLPALGAWLACGAPLGWSVPELRGFNYVGGATLAPEFLAIYFGLSFYIAAFIAEIVRGGLVSVDAGQIEAANAIGLSRGDLYRKVMVPQALRVIIPPLAAQYVSLLKNSSLGVAVGYPDLFSISNTALTYSGRTIEVLCIMAAVYLLLSLAIGAAANVVNRFVQIPER
ncbi:ABC transporter permease subunit [Ancylobacter dichloromethanicus]|uniref:amino acid ABC transporter permease n=1 Tax=Ancylobacter dichloromethanicus TaxID=518825 RepID=UPI001BCCE1FF|nr:ABC transporter permease subunit [Ancylobacter dichloromethanicus]MBS7555662.1 ABC transporter permease subunit [Ancylobacter dichloromethanicus]